MNFMLFGGAGFIGTNLAIDLQKDNRNRITIVDYNRDYFYLLDKMDLSNISFQLSSFNLNTDFEKLLTGQDIVFHLSSINNHANPDQEIQNDLESNVLTTTKLIEACIKKKVKRFIFISSGGTVYGNEVVCPIKEDVETNPINSYGLQKITIEKILGIFNYQNDLDYRIIRLSNPYGPYQRPNGGIGVVTTFIYNALTTGTISVYGDGSVVRDFLYIEDAIRAMINITNGKSEYRIFNLGCGYGTSINQLISIIKLVLKDDLNKELNVEYQSERSVDVPVNYLDIGRYEKIYGDLNPISLLDGVKKTAKFLSEGV